MTEFSLPPRLGWVCSVRYRVFRGRREFGRVLRFPKKKPTYQVRCWRWVLRAISLRPISFSWSPKTHTRRTYNKYSSERA
jgi:hypothetical protein